MKQLNNNTFGENSWSRHWEKLCFLRNTLGKIPGVATASFFPIFPPFQSLFLLCCSSYSFPWDIVIRN